MTAPPTTVPSDAVSPNSTGPIKTVHLRATPVEQREPEERVPLFTLDDEVEVEGEDGAVTKVPRHREFTVPRNPSTNILLKFLWQSKTDQLEAMANLLTSMLGEEGYVALMEWDELSNEILQRIVNAAVLLLTGDAEAPKG